MKRSHKPLVRPAAQSGRAVPALLLLVIGGVIYSIGLVFHLKRDLPYQNAIWHGFVLVAASVHYLAVLMTVRA